MQTDPLKRTRKLAREALEWGAQPDPYSDEGMAAIRRQLENKPDLRETRHVHVHDEPLVCNCQTCGIANARLRGALAARGWSKAEVHHVRVEGYDFRGTCDPYIAVIKVEGEEVKRAYADLNELLDDETLGRVEGALRRRLC